METIGIVCEYNPFHNGHIYHIKKIKELYPDSIIVLVLNGYFMQRGEISIISKYNKTKIALENNIDLILELPVLYGTQSADNFAYYSIKILNLLNVNKIIFGSETNDLEKLKFIAKETENEEYKIEIKRLLATGINYPTALAKSLNTKFTFLPNDLLGISYIKAINKVNPSFEAITIQRTNSYLDVNSCDNIVSASNIRNKIENKINIDKYLPKEEIKYFEEINYQLLFDLLKTIIIRDDHLEEILDVDEGIDIRIKNAFNYCSTYKQLIDYIKTKRYTYNKINRMLIHILLGIKKCDANEEISYIKVLGFNLKGKNYLNSIRKNLNISVNPNKLSNAYKYELRASKIYDILTNKNSYTQELSGKPIIKTS